jgi:hypothetical protein
MAKRAYLSSEIIIITTVELTRIRRERDQSRPEESQTSGK